VAPLVYETALNGGDAVVVLAGELDLAGAAALEAEIERLATLDAVEQVVLDLSRLEFMDSSGLRAVALADRRLREAGRALVLIRGPDVVQRVFEITRMSDRLQFAGSLDELGTSSPGIPGDSGDVDVGKR
jgi:anti-anti-sigma factor